MALPEPVFPNHDIPVVQLNSYQTSSLIWNTWSEDPIKAAVLRAILSCSNKEIFYSFHWAVSRALGQNKVCFPIPAHLKWRKCNITEIFSGISQKVGIWYLFGVSYRALSAPVVGGRWLFGKPCLTWSCLGNIGARIPVIVSLRVCSGPNCWSWWFLQLLTG